VVYEPVPQIVFEGFGDNAIFILMQTSPCASRLKIKSDNRGGYTPESEKTIKKISPAIMAFPAP
jgi:hypothetical protein